MKIGQRVKIISGENTGCHAIISSVRQRTSLSSTQIYNVYVYAIDCPSAYATYEANDIELVKFEKGQKVKAFGKLAVIRFPGQFEIDGRFYFSVYYEGNKNVDIINVRNIEIIESDFGTIQIEMDK